MSRAHTPNLQLDLRTIANWQEIDVFRWQLKWRQLPPPVLTQPPLLLPVKCQPHKQSLNSLFLELPSNRQQKMQWVLLLVAFRNTLKLSISLPSDSVQTAPKAQSLKMTFRAAASFHNAHQSKPYITHFVNTIRIYPAFPGIILWSITYFYCKICYADSLIPFTFHYIVLVI